MSQQSIENINYGSIFKKVQSFVLISQQKCDFFTNFKLGKEDSIDKIEHNIVMYDLLKDANYDRIDLINVLQQPNFKKTKYTVKDGVIAIEDNGNRLYQIWLAKGNSGTIEDFYNVIVENPVDNLTIWEDVEW